MENITGMVSSVLNKQKGLYQELSVLLADEKEYIVNMDVSGLWQSAERKKELVVSIEGLSLSLIDQFEENKPRENQSGEQTKPLQIFELINRLPCPVNIKSELKKTWQTIKMIKDEIAVISRENRRFINDYLSVIQDVFSTVSNPGHEKNYSQTGQVYSAGNSRRLLSAKV